MIWQTIIEIDKAPGPILPLVIHIVGQYKYKAIFEFDKNTVFSGKGPKIITNRKPENSAFELLIG